MVYEDEGGCLHIVLHGDRLYIHADIKAPAALSVIKRGRSILEALEAELAGRGLSKYYTAVGSKQTYDYAKFFGFESANEIYPAAGVEIMQKDLI